MAVLCDCQMLDNCSQVASDREVDCTSFTKREACTQAGQARQVVCITVPTRAACLLPCVNC